MRVDANVSVRPAGPRRSAPAARSRTSTRCARSGRAIDYEVRRQIDLLESGERVRQETRHWDEGDGRTHTLRVEGGRRRLPLLPRARPRAGGARRRVARPGAVRACPCCPRARRRPLWPRPPACPPPTPAWWSPSSAAWTSLARRRHRGRAATPPGCSSTSSTTWPATARRPCWPRRRLAGLTGWRSTAQLTATQAKAVLADLVAGGRRRRPGRRSRPPRASRPWTTARWRPPSTPPSPPTRGVWSEVPRGRGQGPCGALVGRGDEGHAGQGRRQGRHRPPAVPPRRRLSGGTVRRRASGVGGRCSR